MEQLINDFLELLLTIVVVIYILWKKKSKNKMKNNRKIRVMFIKNTLNERFDRRLCRVVFSESKHEHENKMRWKAIMFKITTRYEKDAKIVHKCESIAKPIHPTPFIKTFSQN